MNKVILIGRIVRDPELKYTQGGHAVCTFTLAVDRPFKNDNGDKEADFIPCAAWRKTGEMVAQYLSKGRQAAVEGRMQVRAYDDKDGVRRWMTEVICDRVEFLGSKKDGEKKPESSQPGPVGYSAIGEEVALSDADLPF